MLATLLPPYRGGRKTTLQIVPSTDDLLLLRLWARSTVIPAGVQRRARLILLLAQGVSITQAAHQVGLSRRHAYGWIKRFLAEGLNGLVDRNQKEFPRALSRDQRRHTGRA